jgi:hypothetical protein
MLFKTLRRFVATYLFKLLFRQHLAALWLFIGGK